MNFPAVDIQERAPQNRQQKEHQEGEISDLEGTRVSTAQAPFSPNLLHCFVGVEL